MAPPAGWCSGVRPGSSPAGKPPEEGGAAPREGAEVVDVVVSVPTSSGRSMVSETVTGLVDASISSLACDSVTLSTRPT